MDRIGVEGEPRTAPSKSLRWTNVSDHIRLSRLLRKGICPRRAEVGRGKAKNGPRQAARKAGAKRNEGDPGGVEGTHAAWAREAHGARLAYELAADFWYTLKAPFSSLSKTVLATEDSFFRIFRICKMYITSCTATNATCPSFQSICCTFSTKFVLQTSDVDTRFSKFQ